jgi:hypothetical protein
VRLFVFRQFGARIFGEVGVNDHLSQFTHIEIALGMQNKMLSKFSYFRFLAVADFWEAYSHGTLSGELGC